MWLGIWASRRRDEFEFREFVDKYNAFLEEDIVYICDMHHAEVHVLYDEIIQAHRERSGKPLYKYTWIEAEELMDQLEEACILWLGKESPGFSTTALRKARSAQRRRSGTRTKKRRAPRNPST